MLQSVTLTNKCNSLANMTTQSLGVQDNLNLEHGFMTSDSEKLKKKKNFTYANILSYNS